MEDAESLLFPCVFADAVLDVIIQSWHFRRGGISHLLIFGLVLKWIKISLLSVYKREGINLTGQNTFKNAN